MPKKKSNAGCIVAAVVAVLALCCGVGALLFKGGTTAFKGVTGMVGCSTTMVVERDAMVAYAKDHKGALPDGKGWLEAIKKYMTPLPTGQGLNFEPVESGVCDAGSGTMIVYNEEIAGKKLNSFDDRESALVLFEAKTAIKDSTGKYHQESSKEGPRLMMGLPRGWMELGLAGPVYLNKDGVRSPVGDVRGRRSKGINVEIKS